jgi:ABC-type transport system substrate-binding protein
MNEAGPFNAELELPAGLNTWYIRDLAAGKEDEYAGRNATATLGLDADSFDIDAYVRPFHHPDTYEDCCNFFHPSGTLPEIAEKIDNARFGTEAVGDVSARQEVYDDLWPMIAEKAVNTFIEFESVTAVTGPDVEGYEVHPRNEEFLCWSLHAPFSEQVTSLNRS